MPLCLHLNTQVTGFHILAYVLGHLWPPVIARHELECLPPAHMSSHLGVMVLGHDPLAKLGIIQNIHLASEEQESISLGLFGSMDGVRVSLAKFGDGLCD